MKSPEELGKIKFETCIYRSAETVLHTIKRCSCQGGNYSINGFYCNKRQIFDIKSELCLNCDLYEKYPE